MKGLRPARIALALLPCLVWSQHSSEPEPARFEAEVIVPSDPASVDVWLVPQAGGGLRAENVAVWQLIKTAYYIRDEQLEGGPSWVRSQRYDIVAGPAKSDGITSNLAQHRLRMQALLRNRFALTFRTESRVKRFYSLKLSEG